MATADYLLAIDQGTTSTRAILFDAAGQVHHTARVELTQHYPRPGWVEHDPEEIWAGVVATCREARYRFRHDRQLSVVAADRRKTACERCHERVADDAVRSAPSCLGRGVAQGVRHTARAASGGPPNRRRFRRDLARTVRRCNP